MSKKQEKKVPELVESEQIVTTTEHFQWDPATSEWLPTGRSVTTQAVFKG